MSDSNPRSGDWGNIANGWIVWAIGIIVIALLIVLFASGHWQAAMLIIVALAMGGLAVKAARAARNERDK